MAPQVLYLSCIGALISLSVLRINRSIPTRDKLPNWDWPPLDNTLIASLATHHKADLALGVRQTPESPPWELNCARDLCPHAKDGFHFNHRLAVAADV